MKNDIREMETEYKVSIGHCECNSEKTELLIIDLERIIDLSVKYTLCSKDKMEPEKIKSEINEIIQREFFNYQNIEIRCVNRNKECPEKKK